MKKLFLSLSLFSILCADIVEKDIREYDFNKSDYVVIDVRTPSEYAETGVLAGAQLISFINDDGRFNEDFVKQISKNYSKDSKIALMCRSGKRSLRAAKMLEENGFSNLISLDGGMNALLGTGAKLIPYKK